MLYLLLWGGLWVVTHWLMPIDRNALVRGLRHDLSALVHGHPGESEIILIGFVLGGFVLTAADVIWSATRRRMRRWR
jgi:hypothetical protein